MSRPNAPTAYQATVRNGVINPTRDLGGTAQGPCNSLFPRLPLLSISQLDTGRGSKPHRGSAQGFHQPAKTVDEEVDWEAAVGSAAYQHSTQPESEPRDWVTSRRALSFANHLGRPDWALTSSLVFPSWHRGPEAAPEPGLRMCEVEGMFKGRESPQSLCASRHHES